MRRVIRPSGVVSPGSTPSRCFEVLDDALGAQQVAGEVVADGDDVAALGLLEEERVEGHDLVDVGGRELEQPAPRTPRPRARRSRRSPGPGAARAAARPACRDRAPGAGGPRRAARARSWERRWSGALEAGSVRRGLSRRPWLAGQRSSSPPIMLTEPKVGMMSATICALDHARQRGHRRQARRAAAHAVRAVAAVGDDVEAELAVGALRRRSRPRPAGGRMP